MKDQKEPKRLPINMPEAFIIDELNKERPKPANDRFNGYYLPTLDDMGSYHELPKLEDDQDSSSGVIVIDF